MYEFINTNLCLYIRVYMHTRAYIHKSCDDDKSVGENFQNLIKYDGSNSTDSLPRKACDDMLNSPRSLDNLIY